MAYATREELAAVLNVEITAKNEAILDACLNAATTEIDHYLEGVTPGTVIIETDPGLLNRTCINRAVEWYKQPDLFGATVGYTEVGVLPNQVPSGFARHAAVLLPAKTAWGLA